MSLPQIIYAWPDGTWINSDEYTESEYSWKSDDFVILKLPPDYSDEEINFYVDQYF